MKKIRKQVVQNYLKLAKEKCPFTDEDLINGYIEGFLDCAEMFELKDYYNLNYSKNETDVVKKAHNQAFINRIR